MMWIALIAVLAVVVYFSWKSMEEPVKTPVAPKPMEPVKVEPVVAAAPVAAAKPKKKYGGKVKKEKK
jgi:heme/copper-type cytochrome/quinol oxidase subunit 2